MLKHLLLAKRPDIVLKLEKYGLLPEFKSGGKYEGCAKQWAKEGASPYNTPQAQALAERLPVGWEELTEEEFHLLIEKLSAKLEEKKRAGLSTPNRGSERMLKSLVKMACITTATVASIIEEKGIGIMPDKDKVDNKRANQLSLEMLIHLVLGADLFKIVFREIAGAAGAGFESQEMIAEVLRLFSLLLVAISASRGEEMRLKALLNSFKEEILEGLVRTERFISESILNEIIQGETGKEAALLLQQAKLALDLDDFEGIYETYRNALGIVNLTPELFAEEIEEIGSFASQLHLAVSSVASRETASMTTVSQAM